MATITNLIQLLNREREGLLGTIAWLSDAALDCEGTVGERSIKAVLAHLADHEAAIVQMLRAWLASGRAPETIYISPLDEVNVGAAPAWHTEKATSTEQVIELERVRADLIAVLNDMGEDALNQRHPWPEWESTVSEYLLAEVRDHECRHCAEIRAAVSALSGSLEYLPGVRVSRELAVAQLGPDCLN